jgi:hypothetical protein
MTFKQKIEKNRMWLDIPSKETHTFKGQVKNQIHGTFQGLNRQGMTGLDSF